MQNTVMNCVDILTSLNISFGHIFCPPHAAGWEAHRLPGLLPACCTAGSVLVKWMSD